MSALANRLNDDAALLTRLGRWDVLSQTERGMIVNDLREAAALVAEVETLREAARRAVKAHARYFDYMDHRRQDALGAAMRDLDAAARGGDETFDPGSYDNAVRGVGRRGGDAT